MTCKLLSTRLISVKTFTYHWRVHIFLGDGVFNKKISSRLELSILADCQFDVSDKIIVDEVRLDEILNELWLILENAAPEGGLDLSLRVAELGGANKITSSTRWGCPQRSEVRAFAWVGSTRRIRHSDELQWRHNEMGDTPKCLVPRPFIHGRDG